MKTASFRLLPLALVLAVTAKAQTPAPQTPTEQTREMSTRLQLNEGQFVRLLTLNRTRQTRQREIEQGTKSDLSARASQLAELQAQYDQECSRLLSPSQLSQLQQDENQMGFSGGNG
jgi:Spy/CpxP family protein refolding chaperone